MQLDSRQEFFKKLSGELKSETFKEKYEELKKSSPAVNKYHEVESLVGMLRAERGVAYEAKDEALHALVAIYRKEQALKPVAFTLLLVAMRPALEHIYYKLIRFSNVFSDLFSEIHWAFLAEVESLNLEKKKKIAINLQLNTEKRVRRSIKLEFRYHNFNKAYSILASDLDDVIEDDQQDRYQTLLDLIESVPEKDWRLLFRSRIPVSKSSALSEIDRKELTHALNNHPHFTAVTPEQKELFLRHSIDGQPLASIARDIGMTSGAARARYFRAKQKIRALAGQKLPA